MCYGYWKKNIHLKESNFSVFFRKNPFNSGYAVCCGLEFIIDYLNNIKFTDSDINYLNSLKSDDGNNLFDKEFLKFLKSFKFSCDVEAIEEGRVIFSNEPIINISPGNTQISYGTSERLNLIIFFKGKLTK